MRSWHRLRVVFTIAVLLILSAFTTTWLVRGIFAGPPAHTTAPPAAENPTTSAKAPTRETLSNNPGNAGPSPATAPTHETLPVANPPPMETQPSTREQAANGRTIPQILAGAEMNTPEIRARVVAEIEQLEQRKTQAVLAKARLLGTPVRIEGPGRKLSILYDFRGDEPLYRKTLNKNAAISTAAHLLTPAPYNLDGTGIKVGIWDAGSVRNTHVELNARVTRRNTGVALDDHATHVAGTIAATGIQANAKGMAPKATIDSYDWHNDYSEMTAAGAASAGDTARIPLSNHSYGYGAFTADMGRYEIEARDTDAITASLPFYLIFWASGNEQSELTAKGGYQSVTFNALAKNIVTVGAVSDAVSSGVRSTGAATIADFSSLGPCDDGRIKPDLVANGVGVYSTIATSNSAYDGNYNGTSMATPNAMGSAVLLAQLYAREFSGQRLRASTLKALLIHTADDIGPAGPDYKYGWGLLNTHTAADLILAHKNSLTAPKIIDGQITNTRKTQTHTFTWDGSSPIRATLCWTDPAGTAQTSADSRTPNLKHNLDAKITAPDGTTTYQPFVMPFVGNWTTAAMALAATRGKNNVDNVEQVFLSAPTQPGSYTVTVSLDGTLNPDNQAYSLIITGGTSVDGNPPPIITLTTPQNDSSYLPGASVILSATATDLTSGGEPGGVTQVEFFAGTTSLGIDTTAPHSLNWTPPNSGTYILTAKATDNGGATATSTSATINVLTGDGVPVISNFIPGSGAGGSSVILTGLNFVEITTVKFNGLDAAFTVDSPNQITATVPPLATSGTLSVIGSYGTATSATIFTVTQPPVLISQIYGGSGSGAIYNQNYVELHNRTTTTVNLAGWSLQYAAPTSTTWQVAALSGTIAPGKYHLVGLAVGSSGLPIPTPDTSAPININATAGKLALMNSIPALSGSSPLAAAGLQDFVGFGAANAYEAAAAPAPSTTTAIFRIGSGAIDTGNNAADFTAAAPNPRNSAAAATPSFATWITTYQVGGLTGFTDDPDHDGIPNGVENHLGTAPDSPGPGLTQIAATANALTFQHTRTNTPSTGLVSTYEWSTDLQTWHPSATTTGGGLTVIITDSVLIDRAAPLNDVIQVTATVTQGAAPHLHVRLKTTLP